MNNKKNRHKNKKTTAAVVTPGSPPPYEIKNSDTLGRYLVASRNISAGDVIIEEEPLIVGPTLGVNFRCCIGCFKNLETAAYESCEGCKIPICDGKCNGYLKHHSKSECDFFKETKISEKPPTEYYDTIFPLRILYLKKEKPEVYDHILKMEAHIEQRKENSDIWNRYQKEFVEKIIKEFKITEFTEDEIQFVCGIIDVNCFELGDSRKARAIFKTAFLMAHQCIRNTRHTDDPETNSIIVRATRGIRKGEALTINYGYTLQGTLQRRKYIYDGKYFWCRCKRCSDPTEMNTYTSALVCRNCPNGKILPKDPLNQQSEWKCNKCSNSMDASTVLKLLNKLYNELEEIGPQNIEKQEGFLAKYSNILGPNHYLFLGAKYLLCQIYGRTEGFLINDLSFQDLVKKEAYCRQLLEIVNILEPGMSRLRGLLMYELHAPIMVLSGRLIQQEKIVASQFRVKLKEVVSLLRESSLILELEPKNSSEYNMAMAAKEALASMK